MRTYFTTLGDSAHPNSIDPRARAITNFQELLLVSFREFSIITSETINSERRRFRGEVVVGIEGFARRAAVRSLRDFGQLGKERVGLVYDVLYRAMCVVPMPPVVVASEKRLVNTGLVGEGVEEKPETRIGLRTFQYFLSEVATWARNEKVVRNGFQVSCVFFSGWLLGVGAD
jgi:TBC1 domain family member 8/9